MTYQQKCEALLAWIKAFPEPVLDMAAELRDRGLSSRDVVILIEVSGHEWKGTAVEKWAIGKRSRHAARFFDEHTDAVKAGDHMVVVRREDVLTWATIRVELDDEKTAVLS